MSANVVSNFEVGSTVNVKCTAGKGMFPHELGVLIRGKDQFYESMIDAELVKVVGEPNDRDERPATVKATVVNINCTNILVELPRQVVAGGRRIWIPMAEVATHEHSVSTGD